MKRFPVEILPEFNAERMQKQYTRYYNKKDKKIKSFPFLLVYPMINQKQLLDTATRYRKDRDFSKAINKKLLGTTVLLNKKQFLNKLYIQILSEPGNCGNQYIRSLLSRNGYRLLNVRGDGLCSVYASLLSIFMSRNIHTTSMETFSKNYLPQRSKNAFFKILGERILTLSKQQIRSQLIKKRQQLYETTPDDIDEIDKDIQKLVNFQTYTIDFDFSNIRDIESEVIKTFMKKIFNVNLLILNFDVSETETDLKDDSCYIYFQGGHFYAVCKNTDIEAFEKNKHPHQKFLEKYLRFMVNILYTQVNRTQHQAMISQLQQLSQKTTRNEKQEQRYIELHQKIFKKKP